MYTQSKFGKWLPYLFDNFLQIKTVLVNASFSDILGFPAILFSVIFLTDSFLADTRKICPLERVFMAFLHEIIVIML